MPKKAVTATDIGTAGGSLASAAEHIKKAMDQLPTTTQGSELPEDDDGVWDRLHKAKGQILYALIDLGGKPCGGGRPC